MATYDQDDSDQKLVDALLTGKGYVSPRSREETKAAAQWILDLLENDLSFKECTYLQDIAEIGTDAYWYLDIKRYELTVDVLTSLGFDVSDFISTQLQHAKALYSHVNSHNDSFISANWALTACKDVLTPDENKFFHRVLNVGTLDFATLNNLFVDVMDRKLQQVSTAGTAPAPEQTLQKDQQLQKVLRTSLRTSLTTLLCSKEYVAPVSYSTLIGAAQWLKQIAGSYLDLGEQQKLASFCNLPNTYSLDISATAKDFEVFKFSVTAHLLKENFDLARQLSASTGIFVDSYGFHTPQYKEEYQAAARWISRTFKEHIPASEQYNLQNAATNNLFGTLVLHNSWQIIKASMGVSTKAAVATESTASAAPTASTESSASATPVTSAASTVSAVDTASASTLEDKGEEGIFISLLNSRGYPFSWHNTASNQAAAKWLLATAPQFLLPKERLVFEYLAAHATTQLELGDDLKYEHIARVVRTHYTKLESLESRKIIPEIDELGFHAPFGVDESKSALRWMLRHSLKTLHIDQELLTKLQQQAQHKSTDNNTVITMWHELKTMWLGLSAGAVAAGSVAEAGTGTGAGNGVSANAAIDDTNSDEDDEEDLFAEIYGDVSFGDDDDDYFDEVDTYVTAEPVTAPVKAPTRIDKAALIRALDESYLLLLQEILLLGSCYQEPTSSSQAKDSAQWLLTATDTLLKPEETQLLQQISSHGDAIFLLTRLKYQLTARFIQHHFADLTTDLFDIRIAPEGYHTPRNLSECQAAVSWLTTNYGNVIPHEEMSSLQNLAIYNNTDYKKVDEAWDKIHELMASGNGVDVDIAPAATIDSDSVTPTAVTAPAPEQKPEPSTMSLFDDEVDDNYAYSDAVATAVPTSAAASASVATPEAVSAPVSTPTAVHTQAPEGLQDSDELEEFAEIPVPADTDSSINFSDLSAQPMAGSPNSFAAGYQSPHSVAETKTAAAYILSHFSSQLSASDASSLKTIASLGTTQFAELDNIYNRALNNILYQQFIGSVLPTTQADITPDFEEFEPDLDQDFEYALEEEVEEEYEYEEADDDSDLEDEPEHESASELEAAEASEYGLEDEDTVLSAFDSTDSYEAQEQPNTEDEAAPEPEVAVDSPLEEYVSPTTVYMSKLVAKFLLSKHVHYLSEEDRTFLTDVCYGGTDDFAAIDNIYNAIKERIAQEEIDAELSSLVENDAEEALTPETEPEVEDDTEVAADDGSDELEHEQESEPEAEAEAEAEEASDDGLGEDTSVLPPAVAPLFAGYISPTTSAMSIFAAKFILNKLGAFLKANERVFLTDVCYGGTDNFAAVDAIYNDIKERCIAQASVIANTYDTEAKREREREREQKQEHKRMRDLNAQEALNQPTDPQVLLADYIAPTSITMSVFAAKFLLTKLGKHLEKSERDFLSDVCYDGTEDFAAIDSIYNAIKERVAAATRTDDIADEMNEYEARNALGDYVEPYSLSSSKQSALYLLSNFKEHMLAEDVSFLVYTAKNGSYNFNRLNDLYLYAQELYSPTSDLDEAGVTPSNDAKSDNAASITSTNSSNSAPQISEEYEYVEPYSLYSSRLSAVYLLHHFKKQLSEDDLSFLRHAAKNGSYNFDRLNDLYLYAQELYSPTSDLDEAGVTPSNDAKSDNAASITSTNSSNSAPQISEEYEYVEPYSLYSSRLSAVYLLHHFKKQLSEDDLSFLRHAAKNGSYNFDRLNEIYKSASTTAEPDEYIKPYSIASSKKAAAFLLSHYQEHISGNDSYYLERAAKWGTTDFELLNSIHQHAIVTANAANAAKRAYAKTARVARIEAAPAATMTAVNTATATEAEADADANVDADEYIKPNSLASSKKAAAFLLSHYKKHIPDSNIRFLELTAKWGSTDFESINWIYQKVSAAAAAEDAAYVYTKPVDINTCKEAASYLLRQYQEHLSDDDLKFLKLVAKIGSYNFTRIDRIYNKVRAVSNPQVDTDDAAYAADTNSAPDIEVVEERAEAETAAEIDGAAEAETEADSSTSSMASDQSNDTYTEPYDLESSKQAAAYILLHGPKQIIADDRNFLKQTAKWGSYNFGRINSIYHNSFAGSTTAPSSTQPQRDAGFDANNQQSVQALHRKLLLGLEYKSPTQWIDGKTSANWLLENVSFLLNADEKAYLQDLVEVRSFDWTKVDLIKYAVTARFIKKHFAEIQSNRLGIAQGASGYHSPQTKAESKSAAQWVLKQFDNRLSTFDRQNLEKIASYGLSDPSSFDDIWRTIKASISYAESVSVATADANSAADSSADNSSNKPAQNHEQQGLKDSEQVQEGAAAPETAPAPTTATAPVPATKTVQAPTPAQAVEKAESHTAAIDANADNAANDDSAHGEKAMAVIRQLLSLPQLHTVMAEALRVMRVAKDVISPQEREEFARFVNNVKIPVQSVIDLKYKLIARLVRENYNTISKQDFGVSFDPCGYFAPRTPEEKHAAAAMILELFEPKLSSAERSFFKLAQSSPSWDVDGKWQTIKDHVQGVAKPQSTSSNQQQTSKTAPQSESAASTAVSATVPETVPALPPTAMNGLSAQEQQVVTAIHNLMHQPQLTKGYEEAQRVINIAGSLLQSNERELLNQIVSTKQEAIQPAINLKYKVIANVASQYYALLTQKVKGFAFDPCGYFAPRTPEEKHAAAAMIIERFVLDLDAQERDFFRLAKSNPAMDIDREWQKVKGHVQLDAYKRIVANTTKPQQKAQAEHTNCKSESAKPAPTPAHAQTQAQSKSQAQAQVQAQVKVKTQSPALSQTTLKGVSPQEYQLILTVHNLVNQPQLNKGYEEAQRLIEVVDVFLQQHERLLLKHIKSTQQTEVQPAVNLKYKIIARLARQYYELMQEQNMGVSFDICGYFAPRTPEEKHAAAAMILERFNSTLNFNEQTFFKQALTDCTLDVDKKWHEFRERVQSEARQRSQNSPQQAQAQAQTQTQATQAVAVAAQANTRNKRVLTAQDRQQLLEYKQVIVDGSGYQSPTCKADSNAAAQWQINMLSMFMTASEQQAMAKLAKYGTEQYYLLDRFRYRFTCKALKQLGFSPLEFQAHILQGSIGYRTPLSTAECRAAACWVFTCCYGYLNKNDTDTLQVIEKNGFNKFRDFEAFRNRIVHPIAKKITTLWQQHQSKQRPLPQAYDADTYQKFLRVTDALRAFKAKRANDSLRDSRKVSPAVGASRSAVLQRAARTVAGFERHLEHQRERGYGVTRPQVPEPKPKKHKLGLKR